MKEVNIIIDGGKVAGRVYDESGYAALARSKAGIPERFTDIVNATEDEAEILKRFIGESVNEATSIISRYLTPCTAEFMKSEDSNGWLMKIPLRLPHNCPVNIVTTLKECIESFATSRTLQYWMLTVKPDEANIHMSKAQSEMARMRELLCRRSRPANDPNGKDNIIEL